MVSDKDKMKEEFRIEIAALQQRITELEALDSKRRQTEGLLKEAEEKFQALFDLSPDAYYLSDLKGTFIDGNSAAESLIGYKKDELVGRNFLKLDLISLKQVTKATELLAQNAIGHPTGPDEFVLKRKDGSRVTVEMYTTPMKMGNKTVVLGLARDIGEKKQLQDNTEEFKFIFENVNDAIIHLDETGKIVTVNKRIEDIFGTKREEIIGRNFASLGVFKQEEMPKVIQLFAGVVNKGDVPDLIELEMKRRDGKQVKIEASTRIVRKGSQIESIFVVVRDITQREQG